MPSYKEPFTSYAEVEAYFRKHARRTRHDTGLFTKLQLNTVLMEGRLYAHNEPNDAIPGYIIRLYQTPILSFYDDNTVAVFMNGWYTQTTIDRINTYLPPQCLRVHQEHGLVRMSQHLRRYDPQIEDPTLAVYSESRDLGPFIERILIGLDGTVPGETLRHLEAYGQVVAQNATYEKQIARLARKVMGSGFERIRWDQDVERTPRLWCDDCVRQDFNREHLLRHLESGVVTIELMEHARKTVPQAARHAWWGNGKGHEHAAQLRAFLREEVMVGPYIMKSGRRPDRHELSLHWNPAPARR